MKPLLLTATAALLVLCVRVNETRSMGGDALCLDDTKSMLRKDFCEDSWVWSVSLKLPWRMW